MPPNIEFICGNIKLFWFFESCSLFKGEKTNQNKTKKEDVSNVKTGDMFIIISCAW